MGIIYNNNVEETKIYEAYGLTVYGKINSYEWTICNYQTENALITFRITDASGNNVYSMYMGNNCILQSRIDDTLDNFLWWIAEDKPDTYTIERQVYQSLCASDAFFNCRIQERKLRKKREEKEKKRISEINAREEADKLKIRLYCDQNGFYPYFGYDGQVYIIKPCNDKVKNMFELALDDNKRMESLIDFMKQYPENKDAHIVTDGAMEDILHYIDKRR